MKKGQKNEYGQKNKNQKSLRNQKEHVSVRTLEKEYNAKNTLHDIIEFHVQFERIHPFQDGNARIGRLIMLKRVPRTQYRSVYY